MKRAISILLLLFCSILWAQQYIEIIANRANIRVKPSKYSQRVAVAKKKDIFVFQGLEGNWVKIFMFSGESRYIHKQLTQMVRYTPELPKNQLSKRVFKALYYVEGLSKEHALERTNSKKYTQKSIEVQRLLDDKYKLEVCHKYGIKPALYNLLTSVGVEKNWYR